MFDGAVGDDAAIVGVVKFILKNDATVGFGLGLTNGPNGFADTFGGYFELVRAGPGPVTETKVAAEPANGLFPFFAVAS